MQPSDVQTPTKFVILATQRTGSNYLQSLLSSHPQIFCAGELFLQPELVVRELENEGIPPLRLQHLAEKIHSPDTLLSMGALYDTATDLGVSAIGFRYFYNHLGYFKSRRVLTYARSSQVKVIHLVRHNLLRQFLSLKLAQHSKVWVSRGEVELNHVAISPDECVRYLKKAVRTSDGFRKKLREFDALEVSYEELQHSRDSKLDEIQVFLGVEPQPCTSPLKKINSASLRDSISNYDELSSRLRNTPWESLLEN